MFILTPATTMLLFDVVVAAVVVAVYTRSVLKCFKGFDVDDGDAVVGAILLVVVGVVVAMLLLVLLLF